MTGLKIGRSHRARKALFARGIRRGYLLLDEIEEALPTGSMTDAERWLLFFSLNSARVEVRDAEGRRVLLERPGTSSDTSRRSLEVVSDSSEETTREPLLEELGDDPVDSQH